MAARRALGRRGRAGDVRSALPDHKKFRAFFFRPSASVQVGPPSGSCSAVLLHCREPRKAVVPVVERIGGCGVLSDAPLTKVSNIRATHYTGRRPTKIRQLAANWRNSGCAAIWHTPLSLFVGSKHRLTLRIQQPVVMGDFVAQGKGKVLDEIYVPRCIPTKTDLRHKRHAYKEDLADVIFPHVVGPNRHPVGRSIAYRADGFDPTRMAIAAPDTTEGEVAEDGARQDRAGETGTSRGRPTASSKKLSSSRRPRRSWTGFRRTTATMRPVTPARKRFLLPPLISAMRAVAKCGSDDTETGATHQSARTSRIRRAAGRVRIETE